MAPKLVTLFGKLDIPGLAFSGFLPTRKDPLEVTVNGLQLKLFVDQIDVLFDVSEHEIPNWPYFSHLDKM